MNQKGFVKIILIVIIIAMIAVGGYFIFSKKPVAPTETQTQQLSRKADFSNWKTYRNDQFGFEVRYPDGWSVNYDEARYPESNDSYPRFTISESGLIKDLKCYASFIFKDLANPENYPYSLYSEMDKKQECQQVLDQIISTFKFVKSKDASKLQRTTLYAYEKGGSHIFDGAVIAAIDKSSGKIVEEQTADKDGKVIFNLPEGEYRFQPSPLHENRVVGSLDLFLPLNENKPQTLLLTEIGPSAFGAPVQSCEAKTEAINLALEQANYCETKSDCKLFQPDGFSCLRYVHQSFDTSTILQRVADYGKSCPFTVYKCPQLSSPLCIQSKCR